MIFNKLLTRALKQQIFQVSIFLGFLQYNVIYISKTPKISKFYMFLQWIQTISNIWHYQRKCFLQNSVINMRYMYIAMATVVPSFKVLKAYKKRNTCM